MLEQTIKEIAKEASMEVMTASYERAIVKALATFDAYNTCMTRKECAEWLGVTYQTVTRRINAGEIMVNAAGTIPKIQFLNTNKKSDVISVAP